MGILSSFFGNDQKKDIQAAKAASDAALSQGYNSANTDLTSAISGYDPYVQSGQKNQKFYDDLQGLNGLGAQQAAQQVYANDPYQQNALGQSEQAMARYGTAQGFGQGKFALAGQRIANTNYNAWKGTYQQGAGQGLQAAGAQGNALTDRGNLAYGYGTTRAGNEINYGNAIASSRNTGLNNLLGVASLGVNALRPGPTVRAGGTGSGY